MNATDTSIYMYLYIYVRLSIEFIFVEESATSKFLSLVQATKQEPKSTCARGLVLYLNTFWFFFAFFRVEQNTFCFDSHFARTRTFKFTTFSNSDKLTSQTPNISRGGFLASALISTMEMFLFLEPFSLFSRFVSLSFLFCTTILELMCDDVAAFYHKFN